jgi:hypothetical protein
MAISVTTPAAKVGWILNATSADASGCEELKAAPTASSGLCIKVKSLTINSAGAISITIGQGAAAGAVETALIGPIAFAANSSLQWDFNPPMELTKEKSLTVDASGAGAICVFAQGVVEV